MVIDNIIRPNGSKIDVLLFEKPEPSYAIFQKINSPDSNDPNNIFIMGLTKNKTIKIVSIYKTP